MEAVIALDFDGTLYPITDYDSEQLLLHLSGREGAEELIERDKNGGYEPESFNRDFERIVTGLDESLIRKAARIIHNRISEEDLKPLKRAIYSGCHLAVISCGSDKLIQEFLALEGLVPDIIMAKELVMENGKITKVIRHINGIEDKAEAIRAIRMRWHGAKIIAAGDGPTDIHMLAAADYPFVISWNGAKRLDGYEVIRDFRRIEETAYGILSEER